MWTRRNDGDGETLSLRTGVALAGMDPRELWVDCCALAREHIPFGTIVATVVGPGPADTRIWNLVANAVDCALVDQGVGPLFSPRPVIDLG